ncbi:maltose/maltodextrin ABC transporter substrate-binding protein MalE [Carboxydochorda subterranea]|uniref:Maltodextrin-binding protein n=1 Tax=Carboxydichorda subterranea TaxID=3109565 RepID=A0ABZ1BUI3_9FIRM|nr:maltose/maltodextrin ABC transporter substrate-binding protein MalE [Limnochorda sp. L945t]WRP16145.1 maltose/maltodextrin ABC transporter substrate-binding protein MalE [Limnochorda sp. L945t]
MRRVIGGLVLATVVAVAVVTAAAAGALAATDKLVIWASEAQVPALLPMAQQFEKEYGIKVEVTEMGFGDIRSNFSVSAPTGEGPDLIVGAHDWVGEFARNGLVEPIEMSAAQRDAFTPVGLQGFTYGGKLYGVPYAIEAVALIYNKALVPTPPKTFDELLTVARKLTDRNKKRYGFLYPNNDAYHSFPLLSANGGYIFKFTGQGFDPKDIGLDNEGAIAGARLIQRLAVEGLVPKGTDYQTMEGLFLQGQVGMIMTGPWEIDNVKKAGIKYGVAKIPTFNGRVARPFVGAQGFMVNKFSPNKILAMEFLQKFIMTKEGQLAIWKVDPRIPALKAAFQEVASNADVAAFGASAADGIPMPNIPEMAAVWGALQDKLTLIVNGEQDPASAMKDAARQIRDTIAQAK